LQEQAHEAWVKGQDQATRDFYGLDESGDYLPPIYTQEEMCKALQTVIAGYADFSLPDDYSGKRLGWYLGDAGDPAQQATYPEFWNYTKASMTTINRQVLDSSTRLTPADVLKIAIDANGGNVPMGLLAAHNYLKNLAYLGREYGDPGKLDENWMPIALRPVPPLTGQPVAHLEPWRQSDPANPSGRLDKVGCLYHIFAAAVAAAWGHEWINSGDVAAAGEALLRSGLGVLAGDVPDREKGLADECGARLGGAVMARATGQKPPGAAGQPSGGDETPGGVDGGASGGDDGSTAGGGEDSGEGLPGGAGEGNSGGSGPDVGAASPAEEGSPWVFEGTGSFVRSFKLQEVEVCKATCPYVLTLFPDGRASLHVTKGFRFNLDSEECEDADGNIYFGTWEDGDFSILGQFSSEGPIVSPSFLVSGKFTASLAEGGGGYDSEDDSAVYDFEDPGLLRKVD
jgi:hypothetical protein